MTPSSSKVSASSSSASCSPLSDGLYELTAWTSSSSSSSSSRTSAARPLVAKGSTTDGVCPSRTGGRWICALPPLSPPSSASPLWAPEASSPPPPPLSLLSPLPTAAAMASPPPPLLLQFALVQAPPPPTAVSTSVASICALAGKSPTTSALAATDLLLVSSWMVVMASSTSCIFVSSASLEASGCCSSQLNVICTTCLIFALGSGCKSWSMSAAQVLCKSLFLESSRFCSSFSAAADKALSCVIGSIDASTLRSAALAPSDTSTDSRTLFALVPRSARACADATPAAVSAQALAASSGEAAAGAHQSASWSSSFQAPTRSPVSSSKIKPSRSTKKSEPRSSTTCIADGNEGVTSDCPQCRSRPISLTDTSKLRRKSRRSAITWGNSRISSVTSGPAGKPAFSCTNAVQADCHAVLSAALSEAISDGSSGRPPHPRRAAAQRSATAQRSPCRVGASAQGRG
mmetsp:Transcript_138121/g.441309  ORF Transcript_138121/g.441309 Transcript_138121/m.441309 type:complete len:461 (-) Transcript_138121:1774-3156(-)